MARRKNELLRNRKIKSKKGIKKQTGLGINQIKNNIEMGVVKIDEENGFYCVECDRPFISQAALEEHRKTKLHKRRVKNLKDVCHTQKHAEIAAGLM